MRPEDNAFGLPSTLVRRPVIPRGTPPNNARPNRNARRNATARGNQDAPDAARNPRQPSPPPPPPSAPRTALQTPPRAATTTNTLPRFLTGIFPRPPPPVLALPDFNPPPLQQNPLDDDVIIIDDDEPPTLNPPSGRSDQPGPSGTSRALRSPHPAFSERQTFPTFRPYGSAVVSASQANKSSASRTAQSASVPRLGRAASGVPSDPAPSVNSTPSKTEVATFKRPRNASQSRAQTSPSPSRKKLPTLPSIPISSENHPSSSRGNFSWLFSPPMSPSSPPVNRKPTCWVGPPQREYPYEKVTYTPKVEKTQAPTMAHLPEPVRYWKKTVLVLGKGREKELSMELVYEKENTCLFQTANGLETWMEDTSFAFREKWGYARKRFYYSDYESAALNCREPEPRKKRKKKVSAAPPDLQSASADSDLTTTEATEPENTSPGPQAADSEMAEDHQDRVPENIDYGDDSEEDEENDEEGDNEDDEESTGDHRGDSGDEGDGGSHHNEEGGSEGGSDSSEGNDADDEEEQEQEKEESRNGDKATGSANDDDDVVFLGEVIRSTQAEVSAEEEISVIDDFTLRKESQTREEAIALLNKDARYLLEEFKYSTDFDMNVLDIPAYSYRGHFSKRICYFELFGKCIDENCPYIHEREYLASPVDVIMSFIGRFPEIFGNTPQLMKKLAARTLAECNSDLKAAVAKLLDKIPAEEKRRILSEPSKTPTGVPDIIHDNFEPLGINVFPCEVLTPRSVLTYNEPIFDKTEKLLKIQKPRRY